MCHQNPALVALSMMTHPINAQNNDWRFPKPLIGGTFGVSPTYSLRGDSFCIGQGVKSKRWPNPEIVTNYLEEAVISILGYVIGIVPKSPNIYRYQNYLSVIQADGSLQLKMLPLKRWPWFISSGSVNRQGCHRGHWPSLWCSSHPYLLQGYWEGYGESEDELNGFWIQVSSYLELIRKLQGRRVTDEGYLKYR